jgi:BirA family transcriptional regulator, biotin operon repressor / biotin---[acetyl-CoA-carboxylase] ligase
VTYNAALLRALASGRAVSGAALGRELGVSRAAVWKAVRRLVDLGLDIEALPGRGYRLARPLTLLDRDGVQAALPAGIAARLGVLEVLAETDSTNARVLAAERPVGELVACLAEYQSAGRGRRGRQWLSPPGAGICLSVGGRVPAAPSDYASLPTAVGVACADALEGLGVRGIRLKWPNDLLLDAAKLGGILIELRGESQGPATVAVGIGLNVGLGAAARASILDSGGLPPADLADLSGVGPVARNALAAGLLAAIAGCLERAPAGLGDAVLRGWRQRDFLRDRAVRIEDGGGGQRGIARGIDRSGALLLEDAEGVCRRVTAGEVTLRMAG